MATRTAEQLAAKFGITIDQARDLIAVADGGTTNTHNLHGSDHIAGRRAELAAERADVDEQVKASIRAYAAANQFAVDDEPSDNSDPEPAQTIRPQPSDRLRKGESRPTLTGRTLRRHEQRAQARTEQRPGRHVIGYQDRAIVAARNANAGIMTVGEYLHGIGFPEADRLASAFGRACAKAYRKNHNAEPAHAYAIANGRIRTQFGYADVADLLAGAEAYRPTAAFLAEQQPATTVRELIAV